MSYYNKILKLSKTTKVVFEHAQKSSKKISDMLKKKYKHIKNIKNIKINNKKFKVVCKRLKIKSNDEIKYYLLRYEKDICHLKNPDCANCDLIEFCEVLGDEFSYHKNLKCKQCGYCCTSLLNLTEKDIERIKKIGYKEEDFTQILLRRKYMKSINYKCFFLRKGKKKYYCKIYKYRPQICRIYPSYNREIKECNVRKRLKILHQLP